MYGFLGFKISKCSVSLARVLSVVACMLGNFPDRTNFGGKGKEKMKDGQRNNVGDIKSLSSELLIGICSVGPSVILFHWIRLQMLHWQSLFLSFFLSFSLSFFLFFFLSFLVRLFVSFLLYFLLSFFPSIWSFIYSLFFYSFVTYCFLSFYSFYIYIFLSFIVSSFLHNFFLYFIISFFHSSIYYFFTCFFLCFLFLSFLLFCLFLSVLLYFFLSNFRLLFNVSFIFSFFTACFAVSDSSKKSAGFLESWDLTRFYSVRASKSGDWRIVWSSETSINGFYASKNHGMFGRGARRA